MTELSISTDHGTLSATLNVPDNAHCALLLAHGAGADHKHAHMESLASAFALAGIATLRFNFPFKEQGRTRVDSKSVSIDCIVSAVETLQSKTQLPMFAGGHSFGGRMVTHAVADKKIECYGMILCSFPLHPAGKPGTDRAAHFNNLNQPVLFLSGTCDALADSALLSEQVNKLLSADSKLHWLDTADHGFKVLKRTRKNEMDVYQEAAGVAAAFTTAAI